VHEGDGHQLDGDGPITEIGNRFLGHLGSRGFSPATVRVYAYDLLNFSRFLAERRLELADVVASDVFAWLDWQAKRPAGGLSKVVRLSIAVGRRRPR
jgi:integrase/recombinase XerC